METNVKKPEIKVRFYNKDAVAEIKKNLDLQTYFMNALEISQQTLFNRLRNKNTTLCHFDVVSKVKTYTGINEVLEN